MGWVGWVRKDIVVLLLTMASATGMRGAGREREGGVWEFMEGR
jgi:hypothetical protein